ncbi:RraA famliy [Saccharomonospora viridis]|jgi:regulator of ribonuclease activity A|nr:RraA famliy [Saccharomonospora viridis]
MTDARAALVNRITSAHNVIDLSPAESVVETLLTSAVPFPPGSARVRHHRVTWRDERLTVSDSTSTPSASQSLATADLVDEYGDRLRVCDTQFRQFGGRRRFSGRVRTVSCYEDNGLVRELLRTPGDGCVLVVDGGGSVHTALTGDLIAASAVENGWAGLVINGAVRDSAALAELPLGIKALGTNPRKSSKAGRGAVDVAVGFGGVTFVPGDYLYADDDGVVLLPAE